MQIACVAYLDTFCTLKLTKCGRRAFESGVGHKNQIYYYPIFPCRPTVEFIFPCMQFIFPCIQFIFPCHSTIQYSYSRGAPSVKTAVTQHAIFFQCFSTCYFFIQHAVFFLHDFQHARFCRSIFQHAI